MIVRDWQDDDLERMIVQPGQNDFLSYYQERIDLSLLAEGNIVKTGESNGLILGIAGLYRQWEGRAVAWAILSRDIGHEFIAVHRAVEQFLIENPFRRIEATVDVGFKQGHRWMRMLGFEPEGYLRAFRPDGGDQIMYARIRR